MSLTPAFKIGICNAWLFMSVFLLQMLAIMLMNKRVRERSHLPIEARRNNFERYLCVIGNLVWLLAMIYSVFLPLQFGTTWFYIGLSIFLIGLTLISIATYNFIATPVNQLITTGVYQLSRHPMYVATFFICLGAGIAALSWLFIFFSIIMSFCFYQEALIEERFCLNKYDSAYQDYLKKTPRLIGVTRKFNK
jgi:protein-S-isoprenylcysteine O-methyltransferase Ste14